MEYVTCFVACLLGNLTEYSCTTCRGLECPMQSKHAIDSETRCIIAQYVSKGDLCPPANMHTRACPLSRSVSPYSSLKSVSDGKLSGEPPR